MCKVSLPSEFSKNFLSDCKQDLCAVWLNPLFTNLKQKNIGELDIVSLDYDDTDQYQDHPYPLEEREIPVTSQVTMVGYPSGLWDSKNNYPIVRQGNIATPPNVDFNGKEEFLIDIALYPGSSGSPVFLIDHISYIDQSEFTNFQSQPYITSTLNR